MIEKAALVLAADDKYFPFACIVARQAVERASRPLPAVIIHDRVSQQNLDRARAYCPQLILADASHLLDGKHFETGPWLSRATYLRLFLDLLPELTPYQRVLYLDGDVSVLADPWDLLSIEMSAPVAAAYDLKNLPDTAYRDRLPVFPGAPYFNAGVILLDLAAIRAAGDLETARTFALDHGDLCLAHDQDALNVVFQGRWQVMDWRWNAVSLNADLFPKRPFIRHFTGRKPWHPDKRGSEREFVEMWRQAILASPWPDRYAPERSLKDRVKYRYYPIGQAIERSFKSLFFSRTQTARGNRARLLRDFPQVMARIEEAAAEGRLAERFPEKALLG